jgi:DNA modification methylase
METSKLINGDCLEELKKLDDDSVDLLCTDPPYGYGFMGKHWDTFQEKKSTKSQSVGWMSPGMTKSTYGMKEFFVPIWEEALRVLKPGAFSFVMSAPRSDVQTVMVQTLQEVGFDVSFTPIYWAYATGFPKALNIGKAVDKRLNKKREVIGVKKRGDVEEAKKKGTTFTKAHANRGNKDIFGYGEEEITTGPASDEAKKLDGSYAGYQPKPAVEVVIVAMKPLGKKKGYVDQALDNGKGVTWLDSCRIPFAGMNDEEQFDKDNVAGHQKFIEKRKDEMYGGGWEKPARKSKSDYEKYVSDKNNKENYSDERGWDKWGEEDFGETRNAQNFTSEDTYERVSAFGDTEQSETKDGRNLWGKKATKKVKITKRQPRSDHNVFKQSGFKSEENDTAEASPLGRFAANLLVSDNILDTGKKTKSSGGRSYQNTNDMYSGGWAHDDEGINENPGKGDVGDFSRFYSLDEWWKFRMSRLPEEIQRTFPFLVVPKASKSEKNMGLDSLEKQQKIFNGQSPEPSKDMKGVEKKFTTQPSQNFHPTVKPIDLMSYLVVLGSRKGDVVLDPFAGSGTTGIACVFSERNYLLIEREKEYFKIIEARIKKAKNPADLVEHEWF